MIKELLLFHSKMKYNAARFPQERKQTIAWNGSHLVRQHYGSDVDYSLPSKRLPLACDEDSLSDTSQVPLLWSFRTVPGLESKCKFQGFFFKASKLEALFWKQSQVLSLVHKPDVLKVLIKGRLWFVSQVLFLLTLSCFHLRFRKNVLPLADPHPKSSWIRWSEIVTRRARGERKEMMEGSGLYSI